MKLSIITVNLNNIEGLRKTIDSILCQTWRDYEWLIIDGGSTDDSKELIEQTVAVSPNVSYWCSEPDNGVYNAMNKGIVHAKGDYLNFLNSGDCYANSESLEHFFYASKTSDDVYYANANFYERDGKLSFQMSLPNKISPIFYLKGRNISHQACFIKRSLLHERPYLESYKLAADGEFFFYALLQKRSFKHIPHVIIYSDIPGLSGDISLSQEETKRMLLENIRELPIYKGIYYRLVQLLYRVSLTAKNILSGALK